LPLCVAINLVKKGGRSSKYDSLFPGTVLVIGGLPADSVEYGETVNLNRNHYWVPIKDSKASYYGIM
jgi:hypothetical protein